MIPEGHTIEDIKKREQIIRNFYREWKEKSISNEMLNFCPLCIKMGIPSLNSAILYNVGLYFLLLSCRRSRDITHV